MIERKNMLARIKWVARKIGEDEHLWECRDCNYRWKGSPPYYRPVCPRCNSEEYMMLGSRAKWKITPKIV